MKERGCKAAGPRIQARKKVKRGGESKNPLLFQLKETSASENVHLRGRQLQGRSKEKNGSALQSQKKK